MLQQLARKLSLWFKHRISEKKRLHLLSVLREGDLVLDVGSGHNPLPRADVLCDLYMKSDAQRGGHRLQTYGKPFIVCSAEYLPFKDKSFALVNCCATLEHTGRPLQAFEELT